MKKNILIAFLVISVMPFVLGFGVGNKVVPDIDIPVEDFTPEVWMCDSRIVLDDAVHPGRISMDGENLIERFNNYAFEGEQIKWDVLVMDKNGIEDIKRVEIATGYYPELGDVQARCREIDYPNARKKSDILCYKSSETNWECGDNPDSEYEDAQGVVYYNSFGEELEIEVILEGLKPDTQYQLTLQGRDGNDGNEELGENCENPNAPADGYDCTWECGFGSGGTGEEGFWNFDLIAMTDEEGNYNREYSLEMPVGHYGIGPEHDFGFGFIVKEVTEEDSCNWNDYVPVLMEVGGLDWIIVDEEKVSPLCNARIGEEILDEFDSEFMKYYECVFTVEPCGYEGQRGGDMCEEMWVGVEVEDQYDISYMDEKEFWFFNPIVSIFQEGGIEFEEARPGTTVYSDTMLVGNDAEDGSGVMLDMFISGTDFYDYSHEATMCPTTNQLELKNFRYYAVNGAYSTYDDLEVDIQEGVERDCDDEGYCNIEYGETFNNPNPFYDNTEIIQANKVGSYYLSNLLAPNSKMAITFRLDLPEPCNGNFDSGGIYFWGEAI